MKTLNKYLTEGLTTQDRPKELTEEEVRSYIFNDWGNYNKYCEKVTIRYEGNTPIVDIEGDFYF